MGKIKALLRSVFRYRLISAFFIISQFVIGLGCTVGNIIRTYIDALQTAVESVISLP